ncbi:MAG: hypothetical protein U0229_08715 [Anaeromyxobacter sp.]
MALIFGVPLLLVAAPMFIWPSPWLAAALLLAGPMAYATLFVLVAGTLSLPFQRAIVPGTFPRDLSHPVYKARRLYGLCWTSVYYFKPLYFLCLTVPPLKWLTFRLFGYRGSMDFTVYPDTWIRDLPLLDLGPGTYLANRATLGTNMCLRDGTLIVNSIKTGRNCLVGHLSMLAPGVVMEDESEVAVGCAVGIGARIGAGALVNGRASVNHFSRVGANARVENGAYVGLKAKIGDGLVLPPCIMVPPRASLRTQDDVSRLISTANADVTRFGRQPEPVLQEPAPGIASNPRTAAES